MKCKRCGQEMYDMQEEQKEGHMVIQYNCDGCGMKAEGWHKISERADPVFWKDDQGDNP